MTDDHIRRMEQQCSVVMERYSACLPGSSKRLRWVEEDQLKDHRTSVATITLPYADTAITVCAQYDSHSEIPDLYWPESEYPLNFFPDLDFPSVLASCETKDEVLLKLIQAFKAAVVAFNESAVPHNSLLGRSLRELFEHSLFRDRILCEILVDRWDSVVAINLPIPANDIPAFLTTENVGDDFQCCLLFKFSTSQSTGSESVSPRLFLSASLKRFLQETGNDLQIPNFVASSPGDEESGRLLCYVKYVRDNIQQIIQHACNSCSVRRRVVAALVKTLHGAILEYDAELYRSAAFLMEWKDFYFILRIKLNKFFPHNRVGPEICLSSIYHTVKAADGDGRKPGESEEVATTQPFERVFSEQVPHSPRWEAEEFVDRWLKFVKEMLPCFQRDSIRNKFC